MQRRPAPILFHNATIHTVEPGPVATADWFTVLGDRFQRVGSGPPPPAARRVDLGGACVVPGFVDAHAHFFQTGLDALHIDLGEVATHAALAERLRDEAPAGRSWVLARGFEEDALTDRPRLDRHDLDRVHPERPVWITRVDYHSAVVNTAALRRLRIPEGTPGLIRGADGQPSGVLRAEAFFHGRARVTQRYTVESKSKAVRAAVERMVPRGITAVHALEGGDLFGGEGLHAVLERVDRLPLDVTVFVQEKNPVYARRLGFRHLGGCILVDGSIGSYTAALDTPYCGAQHSGTLYESPRSLRTFVEATHEAGAQLAFHAIGPRAIDVVLDAYERALDRQPRFDHRHRIEHFELATDAQIRRARDLGVVISMQPAFEWYWGGPDGMYAARLGDRWRGTNRLRDVLDAGLRVAGGSDSNVTPPDPLLGMHAAVNLPNEAQRITPAEALRMMTLDAAYGAFNEGRHGSIAAGKEASFAVLGDDPLAVPPQRIRHIEVQSTWSRGREVYRRKQPPVTTVDDLAE